MANKDAIIATMSFAKQGDDATNLMEQNLDYLSSKGYDVIVADGGSPYKPFLENIKKMPGLKLLENVSGGLATQHKNAILSAAELAKTDEKIVAYQEPDKLDYSKNSLEMSVEESKRLMEKDYSWVKVARTPEVMSTFPFDMQQAEKAYSNIASKKVGLEKEFISDFQYGPNIMTPEAARLLENLDSENYPGAWWGALQFGAGAVVATGLGNGKIATVPYGVECPESQRDEENSVYRFKQQVGNMEGLLLGLNL